MKNNTFKMLFKISVTAMTGIALIASCDTDPGNDTPEVTNSVPTDIILSQTVISEGLAAGSIVGTLSVTDPDTEDTHSFSLPSSAADNTFFLIEEETLKTAAVFNYDEQNSFSLTVSVSDGTESFEKIITIYVNRTVATIEWVDDGTGWTQHNTNDDSKLGSQPLHAFGTHDMTTDTVFEFKTIRSSGRGGEGFLFCADLTAGNGYIFHIDTESGEYCIFKLAGYTQYFFGPDYNNPDETGTWGVNDHTNRPHSAIKNSSGQINTIRIARTGAGEFTILINNDLTNSISFMDDKGGDLYDSGTMMGYLFVEDGENFPNAPADVLFRVTLP